MEGGQKIDINLESPLDTKSSDMLVSVRETKFAHNRQKFQGHVLPTSLRYEHNGWAAGWYVYDFKMGGGHIFSRNDNTLRDMPVWLAAGRSKINNTPTYCLSMYTAFGAGTREEIKHYADAIKTKQFEMWFNDNATINARECAEASITNSPEPILHFNYAIEGTDYIRDFVYHHDVINNTHTFVRQGAETSPDLTVDFIDLSVDGTVTALLNNNDVRWSWSTDLYVPGDFYDDEGNKFGKFVKVEDQIVDWKLGSETLQYSDITGKFIYNNTEYNQGSDLTVQFDIGLTYTVPVDKYYSKFSNISWSIQGTRALFNSEASDDPCNRYAIDTTYITNNIAIQDNSLTTTGFNGPDVSLVSTAEFDISQITNNRNGIHFEDTAAVSQTGIDCTIPVTTFSMSGFKMPGSDESHEVAAQLYLKYRGAAAYIGAGTISGVSCRAYPVSYSMANMSLEDAIKEPLYLSRATNNISYKVDNTPVPSSESTNYININSNNQGNAPRIASRDIVGRLTRLIGQLTGVNGADFGDSISIDAFGVNTNLVFSEYRPYKEWSSQGQFSGGDSVFNHNIGQPTVNMLNFDRGFTVYEDGGQNFPTRDTTSGTTTYHYALVRGGEGTGYTRATGSGDTYQYPSVKQEVKVVGTFNIGGTPYVYFIVQVQGGALQSSTCKHYLVPRSVVGIGPYNTYHESHTDTGGNTSVYDYMQIPITILDNSQYLVYSYSGQLSGGSLRLLQAVILNGVPTNFSGGTANYGLCVLAREPAAGHTVPKLCRHSGNSFEVLMNFYSGDSSLGAIPGIEYPSITNIYNDTTNHEFQLTNGSSVRTFVYEQRNYYIHWLDGRAQIYNASSDNGPLFCMDIIDKNTGELLIDHNIDTVSFTGALNVYLQKSCAYSGKLFYNNNLNPNSMPSVPLSDAQIARIYRFGNKSLAFFPIQKDNSYATNSVYTVSASQVYGTSQGVAVFNVKDTPGSYNVPYEYMYSLLSPLGSYIVPPALDSKNEVVKVFARRTFTHNIKFNSDSYINKHTEDNHDYKLIDDNTADLDKITVSPRSNIYTGTDYRFEVNNKYYEEDKFFMTPASIAYYNNQVNVTYKACPGNSIAIDGNVYDLGSSDVSIKQVAALTTVFLPKYTGDNNKYNFVLGNHGELLNVKETKDIINNIEDTNEHWAVVKLNSIDFTVDKPNVTLKLSEHHTDIQTPVPVKTMVYNSDLSHSEAFVNTEYSDDTQFLIDTSVTGETTIVLPVMPELGSFIHDIIEEVANLTQDSDNYFDYDYINNSVVKMVIKGSEVTFAKCNLLSVDDSDAMFKKYRLSVDQNINTIIYFKRYGIYKYLTITTDGITPILNSISYDQSNRHQITLNVSDLVYVGTAEAVPIGIDIDYILNLNDFTYKTECTPKFLDYTATDIHDPDPETQTKKFAKVDADSEYQLIKQHWDATIQTENFWWVDPNHTLKLTKDKFVLEEKVIDAGYDDWNGDVWRTVAEHNRTDYITSDADIYICSSASGKNARSYLYVLQPETEDSIKVTIYDPLNDMIKVLERTITFKHVALGTKDNSVPLNSVNSTSDNLVVGTYSDIVSSTLLVDCKLSAVCINGVHWLGIQYDKNFNQWSFAFSTTNKIIQGYGCIGINGYATGGMIPVEYFDGTGFNDSVYNIKELEAEKDKTISSLDSFNIFNKRVVGDENQQWYITDELKDIVMAVDLVGERVIKLPITNKYAQVYASPSYGKYSVHALGIQIKQLLDLFTDENNPIWQEIIKYAMFPLVWYLSPYTNVINYLQQTLGQYAYVHYNSTSIGKQSSKQFEESTDDNAGLSENEADNHIDALVTDDLSFDVIHIPQEQSFKDSAWDNVLGIFASMVVSATDYAMKELTVNSLQNQSAVSDIGKKFSQSFLQNIGSMSVTGFNMQSTKPMLKSEVTAVKTLDMFYSTSAQQNCYAGPGYVNMQFVAQCVAQSVTSVQLEAQQTQVFVLLKQLTTWQGKATIFMLDLLKDFMFKMSDNMAGGPSAGAVVGLGWIGALVASAAGYALVAAKALVKLGIETVDSMLDSFFPGGIKTNVTAQLSRHNYDIEGKHAYGNKSESFMWPCADCKSKLYTDESVEAVLQDKSWPLEMPKATSGNTQFKPIYADQPKCYTITPRMLEATDWDGQVPYSIAMCKGAQKRRALPDSTAFVIGTETFMPSVPFKNENIGEGEPVFTPPPVQDYLIDKNWNLFVTAMAGEGLWVSCKDTKLFDGDYSNIVVSDSFCGIAAPHVVVEVKRDISEEYLRPWAVSPDAIALNITGLNCAYEEVAHHAFDGYGYRITDWLGSSGMNKEHYTLQYCFQINDRFKRSNKLPPNQFMGNFQAVPSMSLDIKDKVFNDIQVTSEEKGMRTGVAGENKDTQRYSLPIFTEPVSSLPAIVRALSPYKLAVVDGITSLTTDVRISQSVYKIPVSVDFNINDKLYRMTNEYICSVEHQKGLEVVKYLVPALGLTYLGATPFMAYFYNQATRQYFIYQGGNTLQMLDMLERFRDIKSGTYDFINQEVVMPCLATFDRLDSKVKDDWDETDNIIIPVFRHNDIAGEVTPPITTIFNTRSWFKTVSLPSGLAFQGPNRCIINRFVWSHYMLEDIRANKGKWKKVPREEYHPFRKYSQQYESMPNRVASEAVKGWTHNPFLLVTSPLGVNEETDCKFEWEITFAWTVEMDQIYDANEYVVVNIVAETMEPGGKVYGRPVHVFLTKDLFTRSGNYGYYSFRYQSNNGIGNRERLHIWSDGYIAVSSIQLEYAPKTEKRNEILTIQEDVKGMKEM